MRRAAEPRPFGEDRLDRRVLRVQRDAAVVELRADSLRRGRSGRTATGSDHDAARYSRLSAHGSSSPASSIPVRLALVAARH